jgi:hypothetical protein
MVLVDVNNDSRMDIIATSTQTTVFLNSGALPRFAARQGLTLGVPAAIVHPASARLLDIDASSTLDIVGLSQGASGYTLAKASGSGSGTFASATTQTSTTIGRTAVADIDNDNNADLVVIGQTITDRAIETYLAGSGSLVPAGPRVIATYDIQSVDIVDIDGNGFRDVMIATRGAFPAYLSDVTYYPGIGLGRFGPGVTIWSGTSMLSSAVGDLDGNMKPDLVVHYYASSSYHEEIRLGAGGGTFGQPATVSSTNPDFPIERFSIRDIDRDGKRDLVGIGGSELMVRLGNGDGTVGASIRSVAPRSTYNDVQFADFDGDSHLDLAIPGQGAVVLSLGNGDGTFRPPLSYESADNAFSISVGDVDKDGRLDILVSNGFDKVSVLRGRCL